MSEIRFYRIFDENGKEYFVENIHFGAPKWEADESKLKVAAEINSIGVWLSEFLSCGIDKIEQYIGRYNLDAQEKDDCVYAYRLFDFFLNLFPQTLEVFQNYMVKYGFILPQLKYRLNSDRVIEEVYECKCITEICTVLLHKGLVQKRIFKICSHCYKWFIPSTKNDEKYCLRPSPRLAGKNCREAARYLKELNRRHSDEVTRLLKNLRQMKYDSREGYESFNALNREWRENFYANIVTEEEYIDWLRSFYIKKYK